MMRQYNILKIEKRTNRVKQRKKRKKRTKEETKEYAKIHIMVKYAGKCAISIVMKENYFTLNCILALIGIQSNKSLGVTTNNGNI